MDKNGFFIDFDNYYTHEDNCNITDREATAIKSNVEGTNIYSNLTEACKHVKNWRLK